MPRGKNVGSAGESESQADMAFRSLFRTELDINVQASPTNAQCPQSIASSIK